MIEFREYEIADNANEIVAITYNRERSESIANTIDNSIIIERTIIRDDDNEYTIKEERTIPC